MSEPGDGGTSLQEIPVDECYRLLRTQQVGRLAVNAEHHPLVFPVNYGMDGDTIVLRTAPGTKLSAAAHANVTFEVDSIDQVARRGWSWSARWPRRSPTPTAPTWCGAPMPRTSDPGRPVSTATGCG